MDGYQHEERLEAHFGVGAFILILGFPGKIAMARKRRPPPGAASAPGKRCQSLNGVYQFSLDTQSYNPLYSVPLKARSYPPLFAVRTLGFPTEREFVAMEEIRRSKSTGQVALDCLLALTAFAIMMTGCASQGKWTAADQTQVDLGSCGFTWKIADTPEKMKQLETLPQRQIVPHKKDGKVYYIYADARDCKCVYIGDEKAYQQYKQFVAEKRRDRKDDIAAEQTAIMSMDPNFWSIFGHGPEN